MSKISKAIKICLIIMAIIGCICILVSAIFYFLSPNDTLLQKVSHVTGMIATILSLFLSVFATIYGYISSKNTEETLKKIEKQYKAFVDDITEREIAVDEESLESLLSDESK